MVGETVNGGGGQGEDRDKQRRQAGIGESNRLLVRFIWWWRRSGG